MKCTLRGETGRLSLKFKISWLKLHDIQLANAQERNWKIKYKKNNHLLS